MTRALPAPGLDLDAFQLRSDLPGIVWPAVPTPLAGQVLALLQQMQASEYWCKDRLREFQFAQLAPLLQFACAASPFFQRRCAGIGLTPGASASICASAFAALPLLTRKDIQTSGSTLFCVNPPGAHGDISETRTSGSTGQPVQVRKTALTRLFLQATVIRDHLWHRRDVTGTQVVIRALDPGRAPYPDGEQFPHWQGPAATLFNTGPSAVLRLDTEITRQVDWLLRMDPHYLITYPSNLRGLLDEFAARGRTLPRLREVRSMGETLPVELRERCRAVLGVAITDSYSSQEVGAIALQCPVSGNYHVNAEDVLVEVLNAAGQPCAPGEIGRIVVTSLHNFATPLIRYEIRDYAEVASDCPCGRGLPSLRRIVGRQRNLVVLPNGERHWPLVGFKAYRDIAPIAQYQLVQKSRTAIEVRFVTERALRPAEEASLAQLIRGSLGYPFEIAFVYRDDIPVGPGGKFEEFICEVAD